MIATVPREPGTVRLCLCGDVMTGRGVDQALPFPGDPELRENYALTADAYVKLAEHANGPFATPIGPEDLWAGANEAWQALSPDLRLMNLETAVTSSDDFAPKGINYRMNPANMAALTASGADALALANNHVLDFGPAGLAETLDVLRANGVATAGAGADLARAQRPAVLRAGANRVLFYSLAMPDSGVPFDWAARARSPGVPLVEPTEAAAADLARTIAAERRAGDIVVVSVHWGSNWGYQVPDAHRRFAHALIEAADISVLHGHSSHHPRPIEVYRDRLVLYGCGDFLNDYEGIRGYEAFRSEVVAAYFAEVDGATGALRRLLIAPMRIRRLRLEAASPAEKLWLGETLDRESRPFGVQIAPAPAGLLEATWAAST